MKPPIKIAFLLSRILNTGGINRVTSMLTNELGGDNRFDIHIISYQPIQKDGYNWHKGLKYYELVNDGVKMRKGIYKAALKLRKILSENDIEIMISCGEEIGPLGAISTFGNKTKFIYWSHSSFKSKTSSKFKIYNEFFTSFFANVIISLTKKDQINYKRETRNKNVMQIYNPIDPDLQKNNFEYNPNTNQIISVGRLSTEKNFLTLVDVAKKVIDKNPTVQWHIYGDGYQKEAIQEKIDSLQLNNNLKLMGFKSSIYEYYNEYSIMVMTSKREGFPMSLIEGLATKLPLISFDIPTGPNEIINEGVNGFLIDPEGVDEMAYKIKELLSDENKLNTFSKAAYKSSEAFSMKIIYNQWVSLFISLSK